MGRGKNTASAPRELLPIKSARRVRLPDAVKLELVQHDLERRLRAQLTRFDNDTADWEHPFSTKMQQALATHGPAFSRLAALLATFTRKDLTTPRARLRYLVNYLAHWGPDDTELYDWLRGRLLAHGIDLDER